MVATRDAYPIKFNVGVSSNCTKLNGPVYVIIASFAKIISPYFIAILNYIYISLSDFYNWHFFSANQDSLETYVEIFLLRT